MSDKQISSLPPPRKIKLPKIHPNNNLVLKPSALVEESGINQEMFSSNIVNSMEVSNINKRVYNDLNSSTALNDFQRQEIPDNNEDIFQAPQSTERLQKNLPSMYVINSEVTVKSSAGLKENNGESNTTASTTQNDKVENSNNTTTKKEKITRKTNSCAVNRFCCIKYLLITTLIIFLFLFIKWKANF